MRVKARPLQRAQTTVEPGELGSPCSLTSTWHFNLQLFQPGWTFDLVGFYRLGFANPASSSLTVDLIVAFVAFAFWVVPEAARLGMRRGWLYPLLGFSIAFAFAYPLFLLLRERHLRRASPAR